jgi:branched-chain amino acid transport system ATP-binding protein
VELLKIDHLRVPRGYSEVIDDLSLSVSAGEVVAILGANGAGKTTLMESIAGLIPHSKGTITLDGESVGGLSPWERVKRGLVLVPQERELFGELTVKENLLCGGATKTKAETQLGVERAVNLFPRLGERFNQRAGTLSGGERSMLAVGRAIVQGPRVLLLDEPTLGLAPVVVDAVMERIAMLKEENQTVLLVEQNMNQTLEVADRGYIVELGRIVGEGSAQELLSSDIVRRAYLGG